MHGHRVQAPVQLVPIVLTALEERISSAPGEGSRQVRVLAAMNLYVIIAAALSIALELKALGTSTPVVVATTPEFVANGLAQSLQRPGGNFTGVDELPPNLTAKRLRLRTTAAPHLRKVALLSTTPGTAPTRTPSAATSP